MTSWQGLAERRQAELQTESGAARHRTPSESTTAVGSKPRGLPGLWRVATRGWDAGGPELLPPDSLGPRRRLKICEEVERSSILFNFCQSRGEEDNSQSGII
ncbi:uncharacterized protein FYW61_003461 [Anableps anableps]